MDRISDLPDELLLDILLLLFLHSPLAAARTSVLSRRWSRIWAELISPELVLQGSYLQPTNEFMDSVDAALAAFSAPIVGRLAVDVPRSDAADVPSQRITPWLRFASQRLFGTLSLHVPSPFKWTVPYQAQVEEIYLPACYGTTRITLNLPRTWSLRIHPDCFFTLLSDLQIRAVSMDVWVLEALVSSRCPRLRNLILLDVNLTATCNVFIRSGSLVSLKYQVTRTLLIDVVAPKLERLSLYNIEKARISAPKLAEVDVLGGSRSYQFTEATGCQLQLLDVKRISASLLQQFDKVHKLKLCVAIEQGTEKYKSFVNDTKAFPMCDSLEISWESSKRRCHGFAPSMLHILKRCSSIKRFTVQFHYYRDSTSQSMLCACPMSCHCRLPESFHTKDITLNLLEEVEINFKEGSHEEVEQFLKQLCRCKAGLLKKVTINYRSQHSHLITKELCERVRSTCQPNLNVEFNVPSCRKRMCFE